MRTGSSAPGPGHPALEVVPGPAGPPGRRLTLSPRATLPAGPQAFRDSFLLSSELRSDIPWPPTEAV